MGNVQEIIAGIGNEAHNRVTFDASNGKVGTFTAFTVTGLVAVKFIAVVEATVTSGGTPTIEVGTAINTAGIIAQVTDATGLAVNEIWHDATPDSSVEAVSGAASFAEKLVSQDIQVKIASAAITGGRIKFTAIWRPISADAYLAPVNLGSASPSRSPSASLSPSTSTSPSASVSPSSSVSSSPSASVSPSSSVSSSPSASVSPSSSVSSSPSASTSPSASRSPSSSISSSPSASVSASLSPSASTSASSSTSPSSSTSASPSPSQVL